MPRSVRKRMLIALLSVNWWARGQKDRPARSKADLVPCKPKDLELEAQLIEARHQLNEYDRSREHEPGGRWNKECHECGHMNHERHRYCESCGADLTERPVSKVHVCPRCGARVEHHHRACGSCGERFWSPIILHEDEAGKGRQGPEGAPGRTTR